MSPSCWSMLPKHSHWLSTFCLFNKRGVISAGNPHTISSVPSKPRQGYAMLLYHSCLIPKVLWWCAAPRSCTRQRYMDVLSYSIPQRQSQATYSLFSYPFSSDKRRKLFRWNKTDFSPNNKHLAHAQRGSLLLNLKPRFKIKFHVRRHYLSLEADSSSSGSTMHWLQVSCRFKPDPCKSPEK